MRPGLTVLSLVAGLIVLKLTRPDFPNSGKGVLFLIATIVAIVVLFVRAVLTSPQRYLARAQRDSGIAIRSLYDAVELFQVAEALIPRLGPKDGVVIEDAKSRAHQAVEAAIAAQLTAVEHFQNPRVRAHPKEWIVSSTTCYDYVVTQATYARVQLDYLQMLCEQVRWYGRMPDEDTDTR